MDFFNNMLGFILLFLAKFGKAPAWAIEQVFDNTEIAVFDSLRDPLSVERREAMCGRNGWLDHGRTRLQRSINRSRDAVR